MWFLLAEYHITPDEFGELTWPQIRCILNKGEEPKPSISKAAIKARLAEHYGPNSRFARRNGQARGS